MITALTILATQPIVILAFLIWLADVGIIAWDVFVRENSKIAHAFVLYACSLLLILSVTLTMGASYPFPA